VLSLYLFCKSRTKKNVLV
uniref:Uncharacterized protein n=2 Tax=Rhinopithecus TaxID=542827 RepID=A0A2K6MFJ5_RHIBE